METEYNFFKHRHNFAVWAAARATQRGFTTVGVLRKAIERSGLPKFVQDHADSVIDAATFAARHSEICNSIMESLTNSVAQKEKVTYGRAAKLVAIYVKSMVVVGPYSQSALARVAHPPIDRIILQNLSQEESLPNDVRMEFRRTNWTTLNQIKYVELIDLIKEHVPDLDPFWRLERHWIATDDSED